MRSGLEMKPLLVVLLVGHLVVPADPALLTSYLPASMQALAYYIDLLQYEPLSSTTVEPPFSADGGADSTTSNPPSSTARPIQKRTTTRRPGGSAPGLWQPPSWWESPQSTTSNPPSSTARPIQKRTTTRKPGGSAPGLWQPPSWWESPQSTTTTQKPTSAPTPPHRPGIVAPVPKTGKEQVLLEGHALFEEIGDDSDFDQLPLSLIRDIQTEHNDFTNDVESLDNFLRLYDDNYGRAAFDVESAMDRWSSASIAGKKRVPPTKPYVDFLLLYDLLKRDAKANNLSKYEGYSEDLLAQLHELSQASSTRQLHTLFQRMLDRSDIQRSDVVSRIQGIMKDLGNPKSPTSKALAFIPAMQFLP